jgi:CheY-like chemotaxis protein
MHNHIKKVKLLIIDDDQEDIDLLLDLFENRKIHIKTEIVYNGVDAISYLTHTLNTNMVNLPNLIFLDLNMPLKSGLEVLKELKSHTQLKQIPVIILSTSNARQDIDSSYLEGANCYINKPVGFEEFQKVIEAIENFWFTVVKYPQKIIE